MGRMEEEGGVRVSGRKVWRRFGGLGACWLCGGREGLLREWFRGSGSGRYVYTAALLAFGELDALWLSTVAAACDRSTRNL